MPELIQERPVLTGPAVMSGAGATAPSAEFLQHPAPRITFEGASPPAWLEWLHADLSGATGPVWTLRYQPMPRGTAVLGSSMPGFLPYAHPGTVLEIVRTIFGARDVLSDPVRFVVVSDDLDRVHRESMVEVVDEDRSADIRACLRELHDRTRMSPAEFAPLVGASRRTIYHWLSTGAIGAHAATRILRLNSLLKPLAESRDPLLVRAWLTAGNPSPADLAGAERWERLGQLIAEQLRPLEPVGEELAPSSSDELTHPEGVRRAALLALAETSARKPPPRAGWYPRELTGIAEDDEVDGERGS